MTRKAGVRKLALPFILVTAVLLVPTVAVAVLGWYQVQTFYAGWRSDLAAQQREAATRLAFEVSWPLAGVLAQERERPYFEYSYFHVPEEALVGNGVVLVISELAQPGFVPWVLGHFEVGKDGELDFPFLPREAEELKELADLEAREALAARLRALAAGRVPGVPIAVAGKGGDTSPIPRPPLSGLGEPVFACSVPEEIRSVNENVTEVARSIKEAQKGNVAEQKQIEKNWGLNNLKLSRVQRGQSSSANGWWPFSGSQSYQTAEPQTREPQGPAQEDDQVQTAQQFEIVQQDQAVQQGQTARRNDLYVYDVQVEDVDQQDTVYNLLSVPSGMKLDLQDGILRWAPTGSNAIDANAGATPQAIHYGLHLEAPEGGILPVWRLVDVAGETRVQAFFLDLDAYLREAAPTLGRAREEWGIGLDLPGAKAGYPLPIIDEPIFRDLPADGAPNTYRMRAEFPKAKAEHMGSVLRRGYFAGLSVLLLVVGGGLVLGLRLVSREVELASRRADFVSAVTHELKTPLTSIRMFAEMLEGDGGAREERRREYAGFITLEAERLTRLLTNVLDLARLERGTHKVQLAMGDPGEVVRGLAETLEPGARARGASLTVEVEPGLPEVPFDPDALTQIVVNLVDNAVKYSEGCADREVRLLVKRRGAGVEVAVADHGVGIPEEEREKIFQAFYRIGRDGLREGVGLGLSLVRLLAEAQGGRVELDSRPGEGSTFRVLLGV